MANRFEVSIDVAAPPGEVWALADFDWLCIANPAGLGTANGKPKQDSVSNKPVHGKTRNFLFFDGRAASKTVTITALRKVTATIRKSATSINAGQPVIFRGSVSPFVRGTGIVVQRRVGSAAWSNLTTAVLSSTGTWAKTLRPKRTASYRVFVPRRGMNARDYSGATTLTVIPPPRITTTSLPSAAQAFPYSVQLSKSGGSGTWSGPCK